MTDGTLKRYTTGEEIFNTISHGVGSVLAVGGTTLYTMSAVYHGVPHPKAKEILRIFDHASIFFLIAGSYTPFCLIALRGNPRGVIVAGAVWACAAVGILLNVIDLKKTERLGTVLYVIMGWAILFAFKDIIRALPQLLLIGGVSYTGGLVFYAMKNRRYMHSVWHLFVLAGSILHYICIAVYVIPMAF